MKSLKEIIPDLFNEIEIDRVDFYITNISESLKKTNAFFISYTSLFLLTIILHYLLLNESIREVVIFGQSFSNTSLIKRWYLLIPAVFLFLSSLIGYLRVYQQECIEWLYAKHRRKEYDSNIFRLTFPSNYILGADLLRRQESKLVSLFAMLPALLLITITYTLPIIYINQAYSNLFLEFQKDLQVMISFILSQLLIFCSIIIIFFSQRI